MPLHKCAQRPSRRPVGRDDPVQLSQERQSRRFLHVDQDDDKREGLPRLHPAIECLVILWDLPLADAGLADEQNEGVRFGELPGKLVSPRAAGAQVRVRKENAGRRVLALNRGLDPLRQRLVRRMIAKKPARHAFAPVWAAA
jgi:hypothetical protein